MPRPSRISRQAGAFWRTQASEQREISSVRHAVKSATGRPANVRSTIFGDISRQHLRVSASSFANVTASFWRRTGSSANRRTTQSESGLDTKPASSSAVVPIFRAVR